VLFFFSIAGISITISKTIMQIANNQQPTATRLQPSIAAPLAHPLPSNVQLEFGSTFETRANAVPQAVVSEFDQETLYNPASLPLAAIAAPSLTRQTAAKLVPPRGHGTFIIRKNLLHRALPLQPQEQCHQLHK
jgi:hypothetical protein